MHPYDLLEPDEQAEVRDRWRAAMERRRAQLDFATCFAAAGRSYVELDADGQVVRRDPTVDTGREGESGDAR